MRSWGSGVRKRTEVSGYGAESLAKPPRATHWKRPIGQAASTALRGKHDQPTTAAAIDASCPESRTPTPGSIKRQPSNAVAALESLWI